MSRDHYGRMSLPTSGDYIPAIEWPDKNRPVQNFERDSQMTRPTAAQYQSHRTRWVYHHGPKEFESPAFMTVFDVTGYNNLLGKVEGDGKEISQVVLHLCPELAAELSLRLRHLGFTRCERREDLNGAPEICFVGPARRWAK
jgi:hypothetical protein